MPALSAQSKSIPATLAVEMRPTFAEFYDEHYDFVWRNVRRLVNHDSIVDDLVQEVFIVVLRCLPNFEGRSSSKTWVFGILFNVLRAHRRKMKRRIQRQSADYTEMVDPNGGPQHSAEKARELRVLHDLLAELDDDKREVFVLAELEQLTAPEIVEVTGASLTTVYGRLRDARREFEAAVRRYQERATREATP
jgi:RNA polymerase sigma-70 factor (ECF subfamily)